MQQIILLCFYLLILFFTTFPPHLVNTLLPPLPDHQRFRGNYNLLVLSVGFMTPPPLSLPAKRNMYARSVRSVVCPCVCN